MNRKRAGGGRAPHIGAIAQLPIGVAPPTLEGTIIQHSTAPIGAGPDASYTGQTRDRHGAVFVSSGAVADLSIGVASPTLDCAGICEGAKVSSRIALTAGEGCNAGQISVACSRVGDVDSPIALGV